MEGHRGQVGESATPSPTPKSHPGLWVRSSRKRVCRSPTRSGQRRSRCWVRPGLPHLPSAERSPRLTTRQPSQLQWSLVEVGKGARAAGSPSLRRGRDAPPTAHLETGCEIQGGAQPVARPPAPAAAHTGPTPRPPAGLAPGPPALTPASHAPGREQCGVGKAGSAHWPQASLGGQQLERPYDLDVLRPKGVRRVTLAEAPLVRFGGPLVAGTRNPPLPLGSWATPTAPSTHPLARTYAQNRATSTGEVFLAPRAGDYEKGSSWPAGGTPLWGPGVISSSLIGGSHPGNWIESLSPNRALREHQEVR